MKHISCVSQMDREYESPKDEFSGFDSASDWDGLPFTPFDDSEVRLSCSLA